MNSLSWMIYAADAVDGVKGVAIGFTAASAIVVATGLLFTGGLGWGYPENEDFQAVFHRLRRKWWVPVLSCFIAAIIPSSPTIYMIAASEAGETIIKTPEAQEVFNDLKTIIKAKLKEQLPKPQ